VRVMGAECHSQKLFATFFSTGFLRALTFLSMSNVGHVYILVNPSHKLLKIGKTTKTPEERAAELSSTGVPAPFMVAYFERVSDCDLAEARVHAELAAFRVNGDREFFSVSLKVAIKAVSEVAGSFPIGVTEQIGTTEPVDERATWPWRASENQPSSEKKINDAVLALMALGFKQIKAHESICDAHKLLGEKATVEDLVRTSLKKSK